MTTQFLKATLIFGVTAILTGCASSPVKPKSSGLSKVPAQALITPSIKSYPVQAPQPAPKYTIGSQQPQAVWNPTVIGKVEVDAYVDEKGRLWEPSTMYVVRQKGGWNLDAVRGNSGYVPVENTIKPYDMPGMEWGAGGVVENPQNNPSPLNFDVSKARHTGLVDKTAEQAARGMAGKNEIAVYDGRFGWLIVNQSDIATGFNIEKPRQAPSAYQTPSVPKNTAPSQQTTPAVTAPATGPVFSGDL